MKVQKHTLENYEIKITLSAEEALGIKNFIKLVGTGNWVYVKALYDELNQLIGKND